MKIERREFLKASLLGAGALLTGITGYASVREAGEAISHAQQKGNTRKQLFNMCGFAAPPIPTVRVGYVGIGSRGSGAVNRMMHIKNAEVTALCDIREEQVKKNQETLQKNNRRPAKEYYGDDKVWKKMCEQEDIDLIYIATSWDWHTPIAVYAMECGKHVVIEVPAARNMEECWQLVETSERTRKHCMQLENCCYDFFEIMTVNMAQLGLFGELVHGEGAYIHDLLQGMFGRPPQRPGDKVAWRWTENHPDGNPYPTHGLGPVCWAMDINRGDQMDYLTSLSSDDFQMEAYAKQLAAGNDYYQPMAAKTYRGNMNTSLVKTHKGRSIMIQHDTTSPRPYSRIHLLSGTKGFAQKYPLPGKIAFGHSFAEEASMKEMEEKYTPELVKHIAEAAKAIGGHGGMDFIMDWRLIDCLRNGLPLDMDVYDAATWCCITPLSIWSTANRSNSIEVPDFTGGAWKNNKPVNLTLRGGGNTEVI
ncbi:Gfo/Idh/MocA family oxidoreductase [Parabacteroides sp. OttesenSCG-928-K15]|nr:Gfo/Idh/MocA family oxidoreductase [Parabacteroides sp. OttesenSCG-928-K15]